MDFQRQPACVLSALSDISNADVVRSRPLEMTANGELRRGRSRTGIRASSYPTTPIIRRRFGAGVASSCSTAMARLPTLTVVPAVSARARHFQVSETQKASAFPRGLACRRGADAAHFPKRPHTRA